MKRLLAVLVLMLCASQAAAQVYAPILRAVRVPWKVSVSAVLTDSMTVLIGGSANKVDTTGAISTADFAIAGWRAAMTNAGPLKLWVSGDTNVGTLDSLFFAMQVSPDGTNWYGQNGKDTNIDLTGLTSAGKATILAAVANNVYSVVIPYGFAQSAGDLTGSANYSNIASWPYFRVLVTSNVATKKLLNAGFWYTAYHTSQ